MRHTLAAVSIGITAFYRPGYLYQCLGTIQRVLPECTTIVVADDNDYSLGEYAKRINLDYVEMPDRWATLPFDSGVNEKRNAIVKLSHTEYTLMIADDYELNRRSVERMVEVLNERPEVDVVVGTYNEKNYEANLELVPGSHINEHRIDISKQVPSFLTPHAGYKIDLGIFYTLSRTQVLRDVPWDENLGKIGGDHGDWFLDLKQAGKYVAFVPGCPVRTFPYNVHNQHYDYLKYRCRAQEGHEKFLAKRGVTNYNVIEWRQT
jgi:hypothetical protein